MPRKVRELIRDLERAGFNDRGGKGSHRNYETLPGAASPSQASRATTQALSGAGSRRAIEEAGS